MFLKDYFVFQLKRSSNFKVPINWHLPFIKWNNIMKVNNFAQINLFYHNFKFKLKIGHNMHIEQLQTLVKNRHI